QPPTCPPPTTPYLASHLVITPAERATIDLLSLYFNPLVQPNVFNLQTKPIMELIFGLAPGSFDPTQGRDLGIMKWIAQFWVNILSPKVLTRDGPYQSCVH